MRQIILNLAQRGKTIFLSSHNLDEVQRICNRIALIDKGEIKLYGELEKLRRDMGKREVLIVTGIRITEEASLLDGFVTELQTLPYVTSSRREARKLRLHLDGRGDVSEIVAMLSNNSTATYDHQYPLDQRCPYGDSIRCWLWTFPRFEI